MRIVLSLGDAALLRPDGVPGVGAVRAALHDAGAALAGVALEHQLVITHGTEAQVDLLATRAAMDPDTDATLDVLEAETAGMVGYLLEQELDNRLPADLGVVTVLTTTLVDRDDPALELPATEVGPRYDWARALALEQRRGWSFRPAGDWYRRVVPTPRARAVEPLRPVDVLLDLGYVVVCGAGGGIPVCVGPDGMEGVEAVLDLDAVSALMARGLGADLLVLATDVDGVHEAWGTPDSRVLPVLEADEVGKAVLASLEEGTMRPKVAAALSFARGGGRAVIGALDELTSLVAGTRGTRVVAGVDGTVVALRGSR